MKYFIESIAMLLGREPHRPDKSEYSQEARAIHDANRQDKTRVPRVKAEVMKYKVSPRPKRWRRKRWAVIVAVNLLWVVSYQLDIQLLEGSLTASRFMGFHLADLNSSLQVMLAFKEVLINLLIGTVTVFLFWLLLGGRSFCSWVCPYHLLSEWIEILHLKLRVRGLATNVTFHRGIRSVFFVLFALLALVTGYTVYETISPTGIVSRALVYGPTVALVWVAMLLLFELFVSRRAWCRYVCPIGIVYGVVGAISPVKATYTLKNCLHEGECRKVCLVPHVLDVVKLGRSREAKIDLAADCTHCGMCVDACPTESLKFEVKGLNWLK